jgi:Magnesium chelatase, subunit ChlI
MPCDAFWQLDRNGSNPTPSHAGPSLLAATPTMLRGTQRIDTAVYWSLTSCHSAKSLKLFKSVDTICGHITARIHNISSLPGARTSLLTTLPFRAPHHAIAAVGVVGGVQLPMAGEVSLARHGMLLLDELPELRRHVLEVLRQSLENRITHIQSPARPRPHRAGDIIRAQAYYDTLACDMTGWRGCRHGGGTTQVALRARALLEPSPCGALRP